MKFILFNCIFLSKNGVEFRYIFIELWKYSCIIGEPLGSVYDNIFVQLFMPYLTVEYTKDYSAYKFYRSLVHWPPQSFLLLTLGKCLSPLRVTMQVASVPLGLVSTQASLTSRSICLAKLPFFQKLVAVVVIVDLACLKIARNGGRGHMHETNWTNLGRQNVQWKREEERRRKEKSGTRERGGKRREIIAVPPVASCM